MLYYKGLTTCATAESPAVWPPGSICRCCAGGAERRRRYARLDRFFADAMEAQKQVKAAGNVRGPPPATQPPSSGRAVWHAIGDASQKRVFTQMGYLSGGTCISATPLMILKEIEKAEITNPFLELWGRLRTTSGPYGTELKAPALLSASEAAKPVCFWIWVISSVLENRCLGLAQGVKSLPGEGKPDMNDPYKVLGVSPDATDEHSSRLTGAWPGNTIRTTIRTARLPIWPTKR
jgi:hypothetical protein